MMFLELYKSEAWTIKQIKFIERTQETAVPNGKLWGYLNHHTTMQSMAGTGCMCSKNECW
jgi:hypothetical protein